MYDILFYLIKDVDKKNCWKLIQINKKFTLLLNVF